MELEYDQWSCLSDQLGEPFLLNRELITLKGKSAVFFSNQISPSLDEKDEVRYGLPLEREAVKSSRHFASQRS
jgi:hypothetical protein